MDSIWYNTLYSFDKLTAPSKKIVHEMKDVAQKFKVFLIKNKSIFGYDISPGVFCNLKWLLIR